jgi:hypothetical protein
MNRRLMLGVVVALGVSSLAGCGGGGATSGEQRVCSADTFVPNYVPLLERLLYWERFPVTVYFERDANYSDYYRTLALQGFDQWVEATGYVVRYRQVDSSDGAQIRVVFKPDTRNGLTTYTYYPSSGKLISAKVEIGVRGNNPIDIRSVAAHEFGHALGIGGHSQNPDDMMYPNFVSNVPLQITPSDLNTVKTAYCNYFIGRTRVAPPPVDEQPVQVTIRCGHDH